MDREVAIEVIKLSSGASNGLAILADPRTFRKISGPGSNMPKDVHHLAAVAEAIGLGDAPLLALSRTAQSKIAELAARLSDARSAEHTSELQSLMRISYAVFCLKQTKSHN